MLATVTSKAQITLPKDMRILLNIEPGDQIAFVPQANGQIVVSKASKPSFASLRGILPKPERAFSVEEMNAAIAQSVAEKYSERLLAKRGKA
ncbi:MAG: AbrB/MazE/SpoVT family DNA-binding domain-containing protein [Brachymonas sp.]|nr:AbrB/MazE/SpoVT family DNA-binding domain-containing protein [Brachymonas sp.]